MQRDRTAPAVEAIGIGKRFGRTVAVDAVDLRVGGGTVLGLLGPNGAGKSTVVRMLSTLMRPDVGTARIHGYDTVRDAHRVRRLVGVTGQASSVDPDLTGRQNLTLVGRLLGLSRAASRTRAEELLADAGLAEAADRPAGAYSGGMRRRLDLAAGLVNRPAVVFLDEPTTGLDPGRRTEMWSMITGLAAQGSAVLLTTQYLEEADQLAHDIVVMDGGRVVGRGTPQSLKRRLGRHTLEVRPADPTRLGEAVRRIGEIARTDPVVDRRAGRVSAAVPDGTTMPAIIRSLDDAGVELSEVALRLPSLDDVFLALTGRRAPAHRAAADRAAADGPAMDGPATDGPATDGGDAPVAEPATRRMPGAAVGPDDDLTGRVA